MDKNTTERIQIIINFLGEEVPSFAEKLGVSPELIYMIIGGKRNISKKLANKIQDVYGIPFNFSHLGEGEIEIVRELIVKSTGSYGSVDSNTTTQVQEYIAPYLKSSASAGLSFLVDNKDHNPESYIKVPGLRVDAYINVFGDSMYPKYKSGQIIGIKRIEKDMVYFGYAYVIEMNDGESYIKYIQPGKDDDHWSLESENQQFRAQQFHLSKIRRVFKVKSVLTRESI